MMSTYIRSDSPSKADVFSWTRIEKLEPLFTGFNLLNQGILVGSVFATVGSKEGQIPVLCNNDTAKEFRMCSRGEGIPNWNSSISQPSTKIIRVGKSGRGDCESADSDVRI